MCVCVQEVLLSVENDIFCVSFVSLYSPTLFTQTHTHIFLFIIVTMTKQNRLQVILNPRHEYRFFLTETIKYVQQNIVS